MKEEAHTIDQPITIVLSKAHLVALTDLVNDLIDDGRLVIGFHRPYTFSRQRTPRIFVL